MTQYDRYILGTMFKILFGLLFRMASQVVTGPGDIAIKSLISDYTIFVEQVDLWRDGK